MKLANKTASHDFFVLGEVDPFIRDKARDPLEIVREGNLCLKAAGNLSQTKRAAGEHSADHLADSSLLSRK
jgi:hypothetical protein